MMVSFFFILLQQSIGATGVLRPMNTLSKSLKNIHINIGGHNIKALEKGNQIA